MKMYYGASLKEMAQASGFQGETLTSLEKCSNLKWTHQFLKQTWESVYSYMIKLFISTELSESEKSLINESVSQDTSISSHLQSIQVYLPSVQLKERFDKFVQTKSDQDSTWKLWSNFALRDCHAYSYVFT